MATVATLLHRGESRDAIAARVGLSKSTIDRMARTLAESAKAVAVPRAPVAPSVPPADAPDGTAPPGDIAQTIAEVKAAADAAKNSGNLGAYASLMARLVALLEHQRKVTPAPLPDPNDNPDFAAAKERIREELFRLIDHPLITSVR